jgi:hypothetical protein
MARVNQGNPMKLSYSQVWADTAAMLRAHRPLVSAVASMFLFLPALLMGYFVPQPELEQGQIIRSAFEHYAANWHWVMLANVANMVGAVAIFLMVFDREGRTVGNAIAASLPILPAYFLADLLSSLMISLVAFLIVPALYLLGRLAVVGPLVVAAGERNPIGAIRRSLELTKGNGWAVAGLVVIVGAAGLIAGFALSATAGSVILVLASDGVARLLVAILSAVVSAALSTILILLYAALYRHLSSAETISGT